MFRSDVISLVKVGLTVDASGTEKESITSRRTVFCQIGSVGMKESYAAMAVGHNPEIKAILAEYSEYEGEAYAVYNSDAYKIIRTYRTNIAIELTLERTNDLKGLI